MSGEEDESGTTSGSENDSYARETFSDDSSSSSSSSPSSLATTSSSSSLSLSAFELEYAKMSPLKALHSQGLGLWDRQRCSNAVSLSLLLRMETQRNLQGHQGCVNTCSFTTDGDKILTGSDDCTIKLFNWRTGQCLETLATKHVGNIFQAKQLLESENHLVSCAADGQIHLHYLGGGGYSSDILGQHFGRAHKLSLDPICTHSFLSCGEDGLVNAYDVRTRDCRELVRFLRRGKKVPLHSVVHDPLSHGNIFALAGLDKHVKVYDQRYLGSEESLRPLHILCPSKLQRESHITCLAYSCQGELLATYSDDKVYLFDSPSSPSRVNGGKNTDKNSDQQNHATSSEDVIQIQDSIQSYKGHRNSETVKGVSFFGPADQFVLSGSDCGHVFAWDKKSSKLIQVLQADKDIVNCLEPHPHKHMTLATSGLENDCKIWQSTAPESTVPENLQQICAENVKAAHMGPSGMMAWIQNFLPHFHDLADSDEDVDPGDSGCDSDEM